MFLIQNAFSYLVFSLLPLGVETKLILCLAVETKLICVWLLRRNWHVFGCWDETDLFLAVEVRLLGDSRSNSGIVRNYEWMCDGYFSSRKILTEALRQMGWKSADTQACNFIKKETLVLVFSCEFCEISTNAFF